MNADDETLTFRRAEPRTRPLAKTFAPPEPRRWPWLVGGMLVVLAFVRPVDWFHTARDRRLSELAHELGHVLTGP